MFENQRIQKEAIDIVWKWFDTPKGKKYLKFGTPVKPKKRYPYDIYLGKEDNPSLVIEVKGSQKKLDKAQFSKNEIQELRNRKNYLLLFVDIKKGLKGLEIIVKPSTKYSR